MAKATRSNPPPDTNLTHAKKRKPTAKNKPNNNISIAVIVGTRPEIIKMAPIIRSLQHHNVKHHIIHSGQHYSYDLDRIFFDQLLLPEPRYKLDVGSSTSPAQQTAQIISGMQKALAKSKPDVVLVQGDTNTVLGAAIAARKMHIRIGHVEAGLRSYDDMMPEEWNRILADHCSNYLFAPTQNAKKILMGESIDSKKIFMTGNTIVDSVMHNAGLARYSKAQKAIMNMQDGDSMPPFALVSLHRQENVDDRQRFNDIVCGLRMVGRHLGIRMIYPMHPRSKKMAKRFGIMLGGLSITKPVDYLTFLQLQKDATLVLTDSGGVQEEACILATPCVTLRNNTERPETVQVGANIIAGTKPQKILQCAKAMMRKHCGLRPNKKGSKKTPVTPWKNPFGRGNSAEQIVRILLDDMP